MRRGHPPPVVPPHDRQPYTLAVVPVVCVRLSEAALLALEAKAHKKGLDRSAWLRGLVLRDLGLDKATTEVESMPPTPPGTTEHFVPGDSITVLASPDPSLPPGAIRP